jgi:hypothetical protein
MPNKAALAKLVREDELQLSRAELSGSNGLLGKAYCFVFFVGLALA